MARPIPESYKKMQKVFANRENLWRPMHYGLGGGATVSAAVAGLDPNGWAPFFSWSAAVLAALLTFFAPGTRAKAYRSARDILRYARSTYEMKSNTSEDVLLEAMNQAQALVRGE